MTGPSTRREAADEVLLEEIPLAHDGSVTLRAGPMAPGNGGRSAVSRHQVLGDPFSVDAWTLPWQACPISGSDG